MNRQKLSLRSWALVALTGLVVAGAVGAQQDQPSSSCPPAELYTYCVLGGVGLTSGDMAFSPDGQLLANGAQLGVIRLWRIADRQVVRSWSSGPRPEATIDYSPDGQFIASAHANGTVSLWQAAEGSLARRLQRHRSDFVYAVRFSHNGEFVASQAYDSVKIWRVADGSEVTTLPDTQLRGTCYVGNMLHFSANGQYLASTGVPCNEVDIWKVSDWSLVRSITIKSGQVESYAFSPDGQFIAVASRDFSVHLFRVEDGSEVRSWEFGSQLWDVDYSPNGEFLAAGLRSGTLKLLRVAEGVEVRDLENPSAYAAWIRFSPDGTLLASYSQSTQIFLWRVK